MAKLARASAVQFGVNVLKTAVGALVTLYFVNELGAGAFGRYALALAIVNWLLLPSTAVRSATLKRISESADPDPYFSAGLVTQSVVCLGFALLLLSGRSYVNSYVGFDAAVLVAVLFVTLGFAYHLQAVLRGEGYFEKASLVDAGRNVTMSAIQLGLIVAGVGVVGLISGEIVANVLAVVVALAITNLRFERPLSVHFRRLYDFGKYTWLGRLKYLSYSWVDTIVLGFFVTPSLIGAYEVVWRVSALFALLPSALSSVLFPSLSTRAAEEAHREAERILSRGLAITSLIAVPGAVGAAILARPLLALYGESVTAIGVAPLLLVVLSVGRIAESFETILTTALEGLDYPDREFRVSLTFLVSNLGLNVALVPFFGTRGAAAATVVSIVLSAALAWWYLPDTVSVSLPWLPLLAQVGAAAGMGICLITVIRAFPVPRPLYVLPYVGFGALVYFLLLIALSTEIRDRIRQVYAESAELL